MKMTKRIMAVLLAVFLLAALAVVPASAATISITNASAGAHNVYKMFDLEQVGTEYYPIVKATDPWYDFVNIGAGASYVVLTAHPTTDNTYYVSWNTGEAAAFAAAAKTAAASMTAAGTVTVSTPGDTAAFSDLGNGYYLVVSPHTEASAVLLTVTGDEALNEKLETLPTISKSADLTTADLGATITYTVAVAVEAAPTGDYVITDDMADGKLTFVNVVSVTSPSATWTKDTDYTISGSTVTLKQDSIEKLETGATVVITYTAKLNSNATINGSNINTATLTYLKGNVSTQLTATDDVWTGKFTFEKVDSNDTALSGAGFVLSNGTYYAKLTKSGEVYTFDGWDTESNATEMVTAESKITVQGLAEGTYTLVEKTVPAGYVKADDTSAEVKVTSFDSVTENVTGMSELNYEIENAKGATLPETGGVGTTIFYVAGLVLVLAAVTVLVSKKRANA